MNTRTISCFIAASLSLYLCSCSQGGEPSASVSGKSIFDQFHRQEVVAMELRTNFNQLQAKTDAEEYQAATLSWIDPDGQTATCDLRVKLRGVSRRNFCDFPPIKLKFPKKDLAARGLNKFNDLKLVTHCIDDESLVLKEYLSYKVFQQLTDKSFRVQLVKVRYMDESGGLAPVEKYGFLIEDEQELAARLGGEVIDAPRELNVIDAEQYQLLTVFQYMIGNTDWALSNAHNIKLLKTKSNGAPIMVPYDFDLSGLVNAEYAMPHPMLPIDSVRQRYFQWRSKNRDGLDKTLAFFNERRSAILQTVQSFDRLDETARRDIVDYLESFFTTINDPEQRAQQLFQSKEAGSR